MAGAKATFLDEFSAARGLGYTRFDIPATAPASGRFEDGTIGAWAEDAIAIIDHVADGPLVLVGSSMGGWIMLLARWRGQTASPGWSASRRRRISPRR